MAENKGIEGIAGALGKAGAAMIDQSQGTSFYRDALDREKEERARQFALDQLAEKKKQLDNENAKQSLNSLVTAFGAKLQGVASDAFNISTDHAPTLQAEGQALLHQVTNNPALSDIDKQYAASIMSTYLPQVQAIADMGVLNQVAASSSGLDGYSALTDAAKIKGTQHPKIAASLAEGEVAFAEFMGTLPEQSLLIPAQQGSHIKGLRGKLVASEAGSFQQLISDPKLEPLAAELLGQDLAAYKTNKSKSLFMRTAMENDKKRVRNSFDFQGAVGEFFGDVDYSAFDKIFTEENLYVDHNGVTHYRKSPDEVVFDMVRPYGERISSGSLSLEELVGMKNQIKSLETRLPNSGLPELITQGIRDQIGVVSGASVQEIARGTTYKKLDELDRMLEGQGQAIKKVEFSTDSTDPEVRTFYALLNDMESQEKQREELASMFALSSLPASELYSAQEQFNAQWETKDRIGGRAIREVVRETVRSIWRQTDEQELLQLKMDEMQSMTAVALAVQPEDAGMVVTAHNTLAAAIESRKMGIHSELINYLRDVTSNSGRDAEASLRLMLAQTGELDELFGEVPDDPTLDHYLSFWKANIYGLPALMKGEHEIDRDELVTDVLSDFRLLLETMGDNLDGTLPDGTPKVARYQEMFGVDVLGKNSRNGSPDADLTITQLLTQIL